MVGLVRHALLASLVALAACVTAPPSQQDQFFAEMTMLCGRSFEGRVVSTDAVDSGFASQRLVMQVRECTAREIRIPFHVGDNRSRTWVLTDTTEGVRLKHEHRHEDGALDALTNYGGDTAAEGVSTRQEFPADEFSRAMFTNAGNTAATENVWAMEIHPGRMFSYELRRPNRLFRVEFDLTRPVAAPPPPWGAD